MNMIKKLLILLLPIFSTAHPHLFIDAKLNFAIKKNKINTLRQFKSQVQFHLNQAANFLVTSVKNTSYGVL